MDGPPPERLTPLPLKGAPPVARQSRFHGGRSERLESRSN
jgi:hypothetical protein